jgi:ubiquinol-cytochrome c reductase iron-sulfur subunit
MRPGERAVATRPAKPALGILAAIAVAMAVGTTIGGYVEYAGRARPSLLALALAIVFLAGALTVLAVFRGAFPFAVVEGPRPVPACEAPSVEPATGLRRGFLALLAAAGSSLLAILLLPLRSMGPRPSNVLHATKWRRGVRLMTIHGVALRTTDLDLGSYAQIVPESSPEDANSSAVLVRLRGAGQVRAYSRICTHAGCAVCVFLPDTALLVCPCHHSTFDAADGGRVVSGPASQPLPELPLSVDADGLLVADGDFDRPIGPVVG